MTVGYAKIELSEQQFCESLEDELARAARAEGGAPTLHAIAHAVAGVIELDDLRIAEQLAATAVELERADVG
jgi:hypothetical protein